jgi:uncharacterized heparinase superfamily protein
MLESLAAQAQRLEGSLEYRLLGNHLLANAKALLFAGAFLGGPDAARWLDAGLAVLRDELREQILADGAHFELSPMYHSLVLEDVLDLVNLGVAYPDAFGAGVAQECRRVAALMLGWLASMCHPDGHMAFFNDAAFGVAPTRVELEAYAARLGLQAAAGRLGASGYIRLANEHTVVLFDAAAIGPDYQPGHAHADTLSFELSHNGKRVLVNSGTSTYEPGALRGFQRGSAAHNTLVVDGQDQSEMWAAFRVARRARPFDVVTDGRTWAEASHTGYRRLRGRVTHRRRLELEPGGLRIIDTLTGEGSHRVSLFFHLHPDASAVIVPDPNVTARTVRTEYYPEFNKSVPNLTLVGDWEGPMPTNFVSRVILAAQ